jgi:hypothetical protein
MKDFHEKVGGCLVYGRGKDGYVGPTLNWLLASVGDRQDGIWLFSVNAKLVVTSENYEP